MTAARWVALGALLGVALLFWTVLAPADVVPVSNPGRGIEAPVQAPPPRYDWTDQ